MHVLLFPSSCSICPESRSGPSEGFGFSPHAFYLLKLLLLSPAKRNLFNGWLVFLDTNFTEKLAVPLQDWSLRTLYLCTVLRVSPPWIHCGQRARSVSGEGGELRWRSEQQGSSFQSTYWRGSNKLQVLNHKHVTTHFHYRKYTYILMHYKKIGKYERRNDTNITLPLQPHLEVLSPSIWSFSQES